MNKTQKYRLVKCCKKLVSVSAGIILVSQMFAVPLQVMAETTNPETEVVVDSGLTVEPLDLVQSDGTKEVGSSAELLAALSDPKISTIILTNGFELTERMDIRRPVTIKKADALADVTLTRAAGFNMFYVAENLTLEGIILNGEKKFGASLISHLRGTLNLSNTKVTGGNAAYGSGIYSTGGSVNITNQSVISDNELSGNGIVGGGAIYGANTDITIQDSTIENNGLDNPGLSLSNTIIYGGGIYVRDNSALKIENSKITGNKLHVNRMNSANINGGGIAAIGGSTLNLDDGSQVTENSLISTGGTGASANGKGIYLSGGEATLQGDSQVNKNNSTSVVSNGGGMYVTDKAEVTITDAKVNQNVASSGGGLHVNNGTINLRAPGEISGNSSGSSGGGIYATNQAIVDMTGGTILNNSVNNSGSAITSISSTLSITGGLIYGPSNSYNRMQLIVSRNAAWNGPTEKGITIAKDTVFTSPYNWKSETGLTAQFGEGITTKKAHWGIKSVEGVEKVGIVYGDYGTSDGGFIPVEDAKIRLIADSFETKENLVYTGKDQEAVTIVEDDSDFLAAIGKEINLPTVKDAGNHLLTIGVPAESNLFAGQDVSLGSINVEKATVDENDFVYDNEISLTYDDTPLTLTDQITTTFPTLEKFSFKYVKDGEESTTMNGPGVYTIKIIVEETDNFNETEFELPDATITVKNKADFPEANLEYTLPKDAVYNGRNQGVAVDIIGYDEAAFGERTVTYAPVGSDIFSGAIPKNAGSYQVKIATAGGTTYKAFSKIDQYTIAKKPVTGKIQDVKVTQGDTLPPTTITYEGFVEGEQLADIFSDIPVAKYAVGNSQTPGTTAITIANPGTQNAENYALTFVPGTLTITEKTVTPDPDPEPEPTPDPEPEEDRLPLYRVYNSNNGEHLYTLDQAEAQGLINRGWLDEGIGWYGGETTGKAVYRLYNQNSGEHFYTLDAGEYETVASAGWTKEGVAFYAAEDTEIPIYRVFNPNSQDAGSHHYTLSSSENSWLISEGWRAEGTAFYGK